VGRTLTRFGVKAVLTGGACASLHTRGASTSVDMDFILLGNPDTSRLDEAMKSIGFTRSGHRYVHPEIPFYVEFPRGPLAIGEDAAIRPRSYGGSRGAFLALSPTDSCRDRLAAFYHWNDHQSLEIAIAIARRNPVHLATISRWSRAEGMSDRYQEFLHSLRKSRTRTRTRRSV
jgi:hypothetical protein